MQYFLTSVAKYVLDKYPEQIHDVCIVTPNRRSGLFFRKQLGRITKGPIWAPAVISFEDFLFRFTKLNKCDHITLCIEFYKVYKEIKKEEADTLEDFLKWAPTLLKDFNDIDSAIVNQKDFFSYLNDLKNLEAWSPDGASLTDFQKDYLAFFKVMQEYYSKLTILLIDKKLAYQGLAIRYAYDNFESLCSVMPWGKIVFAGFNAMPKGEEEVIKKLVKNGYADALWDADNYYLDNKIHEAGHFLRKYKEGWGQKEFMFAKDYYKTIPKKIHITGIPKNVNQAKLAGNILESLPEESLSEETALVLANEGLLMPVLNSLPEKIDTLNVTMGYSLRKTGMFGFFEAVFIMHMNSGKYGMDKNFARFYYKDLIRIFNQTGTQLLIENNDINPTEIANELILSNRILHTKNTIRDLHKGKDLIELLPEYFFDSWADPEIAIKCLLNICNNMEISFLSFAENNNEDNVKQKIDVIDEQALVQIKSIFRRLEVFVNETGLIQSLKTLFTLFKSLVTESKLSFSGEPLQGLQIIGMLETRNLDFKNLIILSVNEDNLPAPSKKVSFIHFEVRIKFGMHIYSDSDALYAYHFYRLLQRAENIYLVYNTQSEKTGSNEKSRFITQIEHELNEYNPDIIINHKIISIPIETNKGSQGVSVKKTDDIFSRLFYINNEKGFSPSALSIYINCPLQFYFSYVAEIKEAEEMEETIEANTLGNVVHDVLASFYSSYTGKPITQDDILAKIPLIEKTTSDSFKKIYRGGNISTGKNLLIRKMAERITKNFLEQEARILKDAGGQTITMISLEDKFNKKMSVKSGEKVFNFNFKGTIDRIDKFQGNLRIIDYKTGYVDKKNLTVNNIEDVFKDSVLNKSFQLLMYSYIYYLESNKYDEVIPGIFSLRNFTSGLFTLNINGNHIVNSESLTEFENHLKKLMLEIFDDEIPFYQTEEEINCRFCTFKNICNRI